MSQLLYNHKTKAQVTIPRSCLQPEKHRLLVPGSLPDLSPTNMLDLPLSPHYLNQALISSIAKLAASLEKHQAFILQSLNMGIYFDTEPRSWLSCLPLPATGTLYRLIKAS